MAVSFRGASQGFSSTASTVVTIPSETQPGDIMVLQAAGGWTPSVPAGWTTEYAYAGTNVGSFVAYRTATLSDAGANVTVSWNRAYNNVVNLAVIAGADGVRTPGSHLWASSGGSGTPDLQNVAAGDLAVYLGGNRACGGPPTISRGTVAVSGKDTSNVAAGVVGYELFGAEEVGVSCTFTSPSNGSGYEYTTLVISGGGTVYTNAWISRQSVEVLAADLAVSAQISRQSIEVLIPTEPRYRGWGIGG